MHKFITNIDATLQFTNKKVQIVLDGKNLIITGGNGCGKTQFLKQLFAAINSSLDANRSRQLINVERNITNFENALKQPNLDEHTRNNYLEALEQQKIQLLKFRGQNDCALTFDNFEHSVKINTEKNLLLRMFEATRQYKSASNGQSGNSTVQSMQNTAKQQDLKVDMSSNFETYLVTFLNAGYMAFALRQDEEEKKLVDSWLANITSDLRHLFEDLSLELEYREKEKIFYIKQDGKQPYKFSQLSSGYSSILNVYVDLLMKTELRGIDSKELTGIVIIDEIDAHLHVSLQKKILSFLDNAYPNIQFIVSTHSPFVLQSVDNAVIFDLSKLEQLEDLSLYSYEAITKGLLGVSTRSDDLNQVTDELTSLTSDIKNNQDKVSALIEKLSAVEGSLDSKSKLALVMAKQAIEDLEG
ncbi:ATP-binding protein [Pseudoalteromonas sp. L23]|uniref:AAA family ATPase n=1 Tax=unclassified Pseudoalteromonas TaxID=194690 RepID=UPI001EF00982|nr:AAA family ATPase [Pseudoalteromonas sp. B530]MCF7513090.1 ATP-binding protein [Pseudoalteromonas sp. L7]MCF7525130.1 ATP-binding protein [Pseudoalteromonas sp. L23]MCX2765555.1 AAA family ATPase [Pseudoalteromonas sp. B530]